MNDKEMKFLQEHFRSYYQRFLPSPPDLTAREFGFGWQSKIDYRHKAFESHKEYQEFMLRETPLFVSYSTAYYQFPAKRPVSEKGFVGADLVFDLDKTDAEHEHADFFCRGCLDALHKEAIALKAVLEKDFGFETAIVFSGQKGFHLHARSDAVRQLDKDARRQLADYVSAEGLRVEKMFPKSGEAIDSRATRDGLAGVAQGPSEQSRGWASRVYEAMRKAVEAGDKKALKDFGLSRKNLGYVLENKAEALKHLRAGRWGAFCGEPNFENLIKAVRFAQTDKAVTFDLSRLIRLPDSLHGSTGFAAKTLARPESFKVEDAVVFDSKQTVEVIPREDLDFELLGKWTLRKARFEGVPLPAAIFLIAQEKAFLP